MDTKTVTRERSESIAHAREVDERVAAAWAESNAAYDSARPARERIKQLKRSQSFSRFPQNYENDIAEYVRRVEAAEKVAAELAEVAQEIDRVEYEGWSRFFMVEHIHRSTHCSSFRPTTRIGWMPSVSGLTEAEAVAEHGAILCTICFPSAPVEWTRGIVDLSTCAGAGKSITTETPRRVGFYSGNWAECPDCGKHVGIGKNAYRIPKHKPEVTK